MSKATEHKNKRKCPCLQYSLGGSGTMGNGEGGGEQGTIQKKDFEELFLKSQKCKKKGGMFWVFFKGRQKEKKKKKSTRLLWLLSSF